MTNKASPAVAPDQRPLLLLVDDDALLARALRMGLERAGFQTVYHQHPDDALRWLRVQRPDAILLDVDLNANRNGVEVCRLLRTGGWTGDYVLRAEEFIHIPIMMLTGKDTLEDKLTGFEAGTDDFMTKNDLFLSKKEMDTRLLVARLNALLRRDRPTAPATTSLRIGDLTIHTERNEVAVKEQVVNLSANEYQVLQWLARHPGLVQSRATLLKEVWGFDRYTNTRAVDMCVKRLREKLSEAGLDDVIQAKHGEGYFLSN
ncbi:MAG: DNA-binding response regulator [Caldilinea sp. CFX5]|nr:DNA-binding response regulator [Caldilinea sp. CFX5]